MRIKAIWVSINPFHPDINSLMYEKIAEVPDDSDFIGLVSDAKNDSKQGYQLKSLIILKPNEGDEGKKSSYHNNGKCKIKGKCLFKPYHDGDCYTCTKTI